MKNIVTITLVVLALLLAGFFGITFFKEKNISTYLPTGFQTTTKRYTIFQMSTVPQVHTIQLGANEQVSFDVESSSGQYIDESNRPGLTIWVEKIKPEDMQRYKEKAWEMYQSPERGGTSEQTTIDEHEVYLSFRTISDGDDTSKMITMGGGYVFFPEEDIAVVYTMYNPRLSACEDIQKPETCLFEKDVPLPTMEDSKQIAKQIIQSQVTY